MNSDNAERFRRRRDIPFAHHLGLEVSAVDASGALVTAEVGDHLFQGSGRVHGGFYCVMVEMAASSAATEWLQTEGAQKYYPDEDPNRLVPFGVSNSTDFLRPARSGSLRAKSRPVQRGRRMQLWSVDITDSAGVLVSTGSLRLINTLGE